jgi:hypothetical protein
VFIGTSAPVVVVKWGRINIKNPFIQSNIKLNKVKYLSDLRLLGV